MGIKDADKILVLDTIHGGEVLVEELKGIGKKAEGFNPYRSTFDKNIDIDFDLLISPVHLNSGFEIVKEALKSDIPIMSHHEAVKNISELKNIFSDIKVIEVTGTIGKTTVSELICQLIENKKVLSHTSLATKFKSSDSDLEEEIHFPKLSITPANVLKVMETASRENLMPDIAVFEVSLGLIGIGDVGVITSFKEDYTIARGEKRASVAKKVSVRNFEGILVHPGLSLTPDVDANGNIFGENVEKNHLWIEEKGGKNKIIFSSLKTINNDFISGEMEFNLNSFDSYTFGRRFYKDCLEAAFSTVLSLGIPPEEINRGKISTVKGRMNLERTKGRFLIDNSNSGTKLKFIDDIISMVGKKSEEMILIVGEESQYVCEGVDLEELKRAVENRGDDFFEVIIVGEKFQGKIEGESVFFSMDLDSAVKKAIKDLEKGFLIISNVKTWR